LKSFDSDKEWFKTYGKGSTAIQNALADFREADGPNGAENKKAMKVVYDTMFKNEPWKSVVKNKPWKQLVENLANGWKKWGGEPPESFDKKSKSDKEDNFLNNQGNLNGENNVWTPGQAMRIDVKTNFGEDWYKRKFKSGLLNKVVLAVKTDIMSRSGPASGKSEYTGHKFTQDEMLPAEKQKLDSIQWKMTNKVARDFIGMLLGWSRPKEYLKENGAESIPSPSEALQEDSGFGKEMASKALNNRGILGRLKQKIFAGGQASNVISVAFQFADWRDGWTDVTGKKKDEKPSGAEPPEEPTEPAEGTPTSESTDPFQDLLLEGGRRELIMEVCLGEADVDRLLLDCLEN